MAGRKKPAEPDGRVGLRRVDTMFLGSDRVELLGKIQQHGSITKAARAAGISYKTAWDAVNALNNLADRPVVLRRAGGRGGGGTLLTDEGKEVVRNYRILQREHQKFLGSLSGRIPDAGALFRFLRRIAVKVSARNTFLGKVTGITRGAVSAEVTLSIKGGDTLVAVITSESLDRLGLKKGGDACAIVKASSVILGKDLHGARISARNILCGTVAKLAEGPVNEDVTVQLSGGNMLTSVITRESGRKLELKEGDHVCAVIKASSVIVGVTE